MVVSDSNRLDLNNCSPNLAAGLAPVTSLHRCSVCDTFVEIIEQGGAEQTCCGRPMMPVLAISSGPGEKAHLPVLAHHGKSLHVSVGSRRHCATEYHHILWIELLASGQSHRKFLGPGEAAEALFNIWAGQGTVRALCSQDGLWEKGFTKIKTVPVLGKGAIPINR